jgi:hypothetical protein
METTQTAPARPAPARVGGHAAARVIAWVVLVGWVVVILASLWWGYPKTSTYADLKADVATGRVTAVQVDGGLRPHARGFSVVELRWREGVVGFSTTVVEATGKRVPRYVDKSEVTAVLDEPVEWQLREANPQVHFSAAESSSVTISVFGWSPPEWVSYVFAAVLLATWAMVIAGPEPRRATRWAWFWLVFLTSPVGCIAYLLLSGVLTARTLETSATRRESRLTGGWAFLLAIVAGAALSGLG